MKPFHISKVYLILSRHFAINVHINPSRPQSCHFGKMYFNWKWQESDKIWGIVQIISLFQLDKLCPEWSCIFKCFYAYLNLFKHTQLSYTSKVCSYHGHTYQPKYSCAIYNSIVLSCLTCNCLSYWHTCIAMNWAIQHC